jgi:hypothetical protein
MRALAIALVVLAGCTKHTKVARINAPGDVDLAVPMPRENGAPERFEPPKDPGNTALVVFAMPTFLGGTGRLAGSRGAFEPGLEVRFERHDSDTRWFATHLGVTLGFGFVQIYENLPDHVGAVHAELNVRFPTAWGHLPTDVGVGPVVYPDDGDVGGQISLRVPLLTLRARYLQRSGFEFWGGYEVPIPFVFGRSK